MAGLLARGPLIVGKGTIGRTRVRYPTAGKAGRAAGSDEENEPEDWQRIGRFLVVRDLEGHRHALAAGSIAAICETDDGVLLMLPGGRLVHVATTLGGILARLDGR